MQEMTVPKAGRREWIGLAVILLPTLLYAMDLTVLHLAVPAISRDLAPTSAQLLWIIDIYGFLVAGSLLTMGTLGDRIGRRKLMLIGATLFGLASLLAAFSTSFEMLIAARALLGIAGATIAPSTLSLLRNMFHDPAQFSVAIGVWVSGFSAGSAIGPLVGGVLLERFWWGSVFLISVPVMVVLLITAPLLLPEYRDPDAGRLDLLSAALSLIAVLAVGAIFVRRQRTLADPLIDMKLFTNRAFSGSLAMYMLGVLFAFGIFYFTGQYLQLVAGMSPLHAGVWSLPSAAAFIIGSNLAPRIVRRFRPGRVVAVGMSLGAIGLAMLSQVGVDSLPLLLLGSFVMAVGVSPVVTLATDIIVGSAPPEQ